MRAWSAKQRFPVAQWIKQLDQLYSESIRIHNKEAKKKKLESLSPGASPSATRPSSPGSIATYTEQAPHVLLSPSPESNLLSPSPIATPTPRALTTPDLPTPSAPWVAGSRSSSPRASVASSNGGFYGNSVARESTISVDSFAIRAQRDGMPSPGLPPNDFGLGIPRPAFSTSHRNSSLLSLPEVVGDRHDLKLQQVDQFFNDSNGEYYALFEEMLDDLNAQNSAGELCIETFLKKSEKEWFARYRDAKLGRHRESRMASPANSRPVSRNGQGRNESVVSRGRQRHRSATPSSLARSVFETSPPPGGTVDDEFLLGDGYQAPTGLKK